MRQPFSTPLATLIVTTFGLGIAQPARASDASGADATLEKSSALYKNARSLQEHGQWAEAEKVYQAAWDLRPTFDIAGNLGDCELHVGQPREAAEHLSYALKSLPAGWTAEQKAALTGRLKEAKSKIATLYVSVDVEGAEVVVNGRAAPPSTAYEVFVEPGPYTVEGRHSGYTPDKKERTITAGAEDHVSLKLTRLGRSKVPAYLMGGVGVVALGIGASFIGIAESKRSEAKALSLETNHACPVSDPLPQGKCKDLASVASSGDTFGNVGIVGLAVAGAAAVGVATYLLWPESRDEKAAARSVRVLPSASATGGGLFAVGSF